MKNDGDNDGKTGFGGSRKKISTVYDKGDFIKSGREVDLPKKNW